ncbi:MAG: hypothetical protein R3Y53_01825 [Bacillota bacterium]
MERHESIMLFSFLGVTKVRYHYQKPTQYQSVYGQLYTCDHPVYDTCTLYQIQNKGLAVIQQRFDSVCKRTWWTEIDAHLTDVIYLHPKFKAYFDERSDICRDGFYPTVTVRQLMWALKMKPIRRERWETVFDKKDI